MALCSSEKKWASIDAFCALTCVIIASLVGAMTCGYALLTTYEKAFGFSAQEVTVFGLMMGAAYAIGLVVVMFFSKRIHVPRAIAVSTFFCGVATLVQVVPYFYGAGRGGASDVSSALRFVYDENLPTCHNEGSFAERERRCLSRGLNATLDEPARRSLSPEMILFACTGIVKSLVSPVFSILIVPYMDNHLKHTESAIYQTYFRVGATLGPMVGMPLGAYLSTIALDDAFAGLSPKDPQFIGAWWICDVVFGPLLLAASIPMFLFPEHPYGWKPRKKSLVEKRKNVCFVVVDFFKEIWKLLKNRMYLCCYLSKLVASLGGAGIWLFLPKTLEHQFGYTAWQATLFIALTAAAGGIFGNIFNGCLIRRFNLKPPAMVVHFLLTKVVVVCTVAALIFITCPPAPIDSLLASKETNMTTSCNADCRCGQEAFAPVCVRDGRSFFTPCHAGCRNKVFEGEETFFSNCSCVESSIHDEDAFPFDAKLGYCDRAFCVNSVVYVVVICVWAIVGNSNEISETLTKFRAIKDGQKAIATGLGNISNSLLSGGFSAFLIGPLIDSTCRVWKVQCGSLKQCFLYDMERYHFLVHILVIVCAVPASLIYLGVFVEARKRNWDHLDHHVDDTDPPDHPDHPDHLGCKEPAEEMEALRRKKSDVA